MLKNKIIICAGNYEEFERYLEENGLTTEHAIYGNLDHLLGVKAQNVIAIGSFWERKDSLKIYRYAKSRVEPVGIRSGKIFVAKGDQLSIPFHEYPYEGFCGNCDTVFGYLKKKVKIGDQVKSENVTLPSGDKPSHGDEIKHNCSQLLPLCRLRS